MKKLFRFTWSSLLLLCCTIAYGQEDANPQAEDSLNLPKIKQLNERLGPRQSPDHEIPPTANDDALEKYILCLTKRRYSASTVFNCSKALRQYLTFIAPQAPGALDHTQVCGALARLVEGRGIGSSYQKLLNNAVRLNYEAIEGRPRLACNPLRQSTSPA